MFFIFCSLSFSYYKNKEMGKLSLNHCALYHGVHFKLLLLPVKLPLPTAFCRQNAASWTIRGFVESG